MNNIRILSLYSGSTGNAFLIQGPRTSILIDAGKSARRLCTALAEVGVSPAEIKAIFITHEHSDHVSALPVFLKKYPMPVHVLSESAYRIGNDPSVSPCLCLHRPSFCEELDGMRVTAFPTPHDSHASTGYRIEIETEEGSTFRIGYATDIGHVSKEVEAGLSGCEAVILESNHDLEMLRMGPYPYLLKQRIASRHGHLSNADSAAFAARLTAGGTHTIMLAHLSQENNEPQLAYHECLSAVADERVRICVACPDQVTEVAL